MAATHSADENATFQVHTPKTAEEVAAKVAEAKADKTPLAIVGGGSHKAYGRPVNEGETLNLSLLTGVTLYEPKELVLSARAGTRLTELEALLAENGQGFAFEPPHFDALFGHEKPLSTIGGVVATNRSGPRRVIAGAARDSLIGVVFVNGLGEIVRTGGRVMKNVTGYDMTKLQAGANGGLGVLTELTFKLRPLAETETTLLYKGVDVDTALTLMTKALGAPQEASAAATYQKDGEWVTAVRMEGFEASLAGRVDALKTEISKTLTPQSLEKDASRTLWASVRDVADFIPFGTALWRISTVPTAAKAILDATKNIAVAPPLIDWGGGLIWLAVEDTGTANAEMVRSSLPKGKGHATLFRASEATRHAAQPFEPLPEALMLANKKVKEAFDPAGILNPGFMHAGL